MNINNEIKNTLSEASKNILKINNSELSFEEE